MYLNILRFRLNKIVVCNHREITELQKEVVGEDDNEKCFWVGKNTLKKWRAYARENLEEKMRLEAIQFVEDLEKKSQQSISEVQSKLSKGMLICKAWFSVFLSQRNQQ